MARHDAIMCTRRATPVYLAGFAAYPLNALWA
jgi:hypothetical protein